MRTPPPRLTPVLGRPDATDAPAPPGEPAWVTVAQPAAAWELGLTAAGLRPGHVVLVPALHDAGRLAPFAARGLVLRAYDLDDAFRPDPGSLETAAAGARALLLAHQLGFPADAPRWRAWCEGRGLLLLEDAIDGWATSDRGVPAGSSGHVAVVGLAPPESGSGAVAVRAGSSSTAAPAWSARAAHRRDERAALRRRAAAAVMTAADGLLPPELPRVDRGACPRAVPLRAAVPGAAPAWGPPHPAVGGRPAPRADRLRALTALPVGDRAPDATLRAVGRAAGAAGDVRVERVGSIGELREDWTRLAAAAASPFATHEWASAWWEAFGGGHELLLHVARRPSGEVVAILPLYGALRRGRARVVRFLGHGPGDELGPVCAPADAPAAARALRAVVRALGPAALLLAERLPGQSGWAALLGGRVLRRDATPLLAIDGRSWDEWLASRSRNFRDQVRRRERKLRREHDVSLRLFRGPAEVPAAFDTLVALHEARWAGGSRSFAGARLDFHRDFLDRAARRGWARLWVMQVDGRPAAAWYGWRLGNADWYYQAGRAPELDDAHVGFVLLCHTVRDAFEAGRREYRLLLGDEPYKARFATDDPGLDTLALGTPAAALAAQTAVRAVRAVPRGARRRLTRRLG